MRWQAKLRTVSGSTDAIPVAVDAARLARESRHAVVVLPGFVGRDETGDRTVLGRGGSDLTALFIAQQLRAHCILIKDVDGLYTSNPAATTIRPSRYARASYETAARLGGGVVQPKAIRFAAANKLRFDITSIGAFGVTEVGPLNDQLDGVHSRLEPTRVALLGCGAVGGGVYERLAAAPDLFHVIGVGTRTGVRARAAGVPDELITSDLEGLVEQPCEVVIELIGGTKRAAALTERALRRGRQVVSANKALMAHAHKLYESIAEENGATLRYNAGVGGVMPALETIKRAKVGGPLQSFSGVVNGTCNFVLEQLAAGSTFSGAVCLAQECGFAEQDPGLDLEGFDAAQKLILMARAAFDVSLPIHAIARKGIQGLSTDSLKQAQERGQTIRLVAECEKISGQLIASVSPVELTLDHPLAQVTGAENRLIIKREAGEQLMVFGTGAGRWPTTEAVMADLFEIRRQESAKELEQLEACA
jgi:homoserine dehydrogenase